MIEPLELSGHTCTQLWTKGLVSSYLIDAYNCTYANSTVSRDSSCPLQTFPEPTTESHYNQHMRSKPRSRRRQKENKPLYRIRHPSTLARQPQPTLCTRPTSRHVPQASPLPLRNQRCGASGPHQWVSLRGILARVSLSAVECDGTENGLQHRGCSDGISGNTRKGS
jgi:hypothetical protein